MIINPGSIELENAASAKRVMALLESCLASFDGDLGYKTPSCGLIEQTDIPSFVGISSSLGVILIDVVEEPIAGISEDPEYWEAQNSRLVRSRDYVISEFKQEITNRFAKDSRLFDRKRSATKVPINSLIIFSSNSNDEVAKIADIGEFICESTGADDLKNDIANFLSFALAQTTKNQIDSIIMDRAYAALETTSIFEKKKPSSALSQPLITKADFIHEALGTTFKLDAQQRQVALQIPDGPQRIRGLAGTGKTVILSLKAALAHKTCRDFKILFVFNTQSMYGTITDMVTKYFAAETRSTIDETKVSILHAWGGATTRNGLYSTLCKKYGISPLSFDQVRQSRDALAAIYNDLLNRTKGKLEQEYDLVLIDEAQDFPPEFFETIFHIAKDPKRIIWAYDEFQSLKDMRMREPDELFGVNDSGLPNMPNSVLEGKYSGLIDKDFVLPNSYRNPRQPLMLAHALALGLRRKPNIIEAFPDLQSWKAIGYDVVEPRGKTTFVEGDHLVIERPEQHSRNRLEILLKEHSRSDSIIDLECYPDKLDAFSTVVNYISNDIKVEGVPPEQICLISLDTRNAKADLQEIRRRLDQVGIQAVSPGLIEAPSIYRVRDCVTLSTPFRAKGNEAYIVYVLGCQLAATDPTFKARNALFVSITRTMGWCKLFAYGPFADKFQGEFKDLLETYPRFDFIYPDPVTLARSRSILSGDTRLEEQEQLIEQLLQENPDFVIDKILSSDAYIKRNSSDKS